MTILADNCVTHDLRRVMEPTQRCYREYPDTDIHIVCLLKGRPFLNVVKECRRQLKMRVAGGQYHTSIDYLYKATFEFMMTVFNLSLVDCIRSDPSNDTAAAW